MGQTRAPAPYRLDELGWLQFERLCDLVLERDAAAEGLTWRGRADVGRVALADDGVTLAPRALRLPGPLAVAVVWVRSLSTPENRLGHLFAGVLALPSQLGFWFDRVLVLTNLDAGGAEQALAERFTEVTQFVVLGARELGQSLDRDPALRGTMPSLLGLRDLEPLIDTQARGRG